MTDIVKKDGYLNLKFKPTNNVFLLPIGEAERILESDRGNFVVLDEDYVKTPKEVKTSTTYNKVVKNDVKPLEDYTYSELKAYCKANNLKQSGNTAELRGRVMEYNKLCTLRCKYYDLTNKNVTDDTKVEDLEKEIIEILREKVEAAGKEIEQEPVTIEYLEELLG